MSRIQIVSYAAELARSEDGAVAVEWMAIYGILCTFSAVIASAIREPAAQLRDNVSRKYEGDPEGIAAVAAGGSYTFDDPIIDVSAVPRFLRKPTDRR